MPMLNQPTLFSMADYRNPGSSLRRESLLRALQKTPKTWMFPPGIALKCRTSFGSLAQQFGTADGPPVRELME